MNTKQTNPGSPFCQTPGCETKVSGKTGGGKWFKYCDDCKSGAYPAKKLHHELRGIRSAQK
jgi:hypothetical protein